MNLQTHVASVNWRTSGPVGELYEARREISTSLGNMDGDRFWAYALWPIPTGQLWTEVDNASRRKAFLQSAGDRDRMTVELREVAADGVAHQYVVGRPGTTHEGRPTELVTWADGQRQSVYPGEVYTAEEAAPVYLSYYDTGTVPAGYVLRELDLNESQ